MRLCAAAGSTCKGEGVRRDHYARASNSGRHFARFTVVVKHLVRIVAVMLVAVASQTVVDLSGKERESRASVLRSAQLWTAADISSKNFVEGPRGPGSFTPGRTV